MPYRICFLGIPHSGKSYHALEATYYLKSLGHRVEFIEEPFKDWAYESRRLPGLAEQIEGFGIQLRRELSRLESGYSIVTDSGLITNLWYLRLHTDHIQSFVEIIRDLELKYPTLNILLPPLDEIPPDDAGRWKPHLRDRQETFRNFQRFLDRYGFSYYRPELGDGQNIRTIISKGLYLDQGDQLHASA